MVDATHDQLLADTQPGLARANDDDAKRVGQNEPKKRRLEAGTKLGQNRRTQSIVANIADNLKTQASAPQITLSA